MAGAMLGVLLSGAGGCSILGANGPCSCPPPPTMALVHLGCDPVQPPAVTTTGPCAVRPVVLPNGMRPEGAVSRAIPTPHGCGEGFVATDATASPPASVCIADAGGDDQRSLSR